MKRLFLALLVVSLVAAGCGDKKKSSNASGKAGVDAKGSTEATNPDGTPLNSSGPQDSSALMGQTPATNPDGSPVAPGQPGQPGAQPGRPGQPGAQPGQTTTTKPPFPVKLRLERSCVRKGAGGDTQGLRVITDKGDTVAFSTEYSDKSNELSNPSYKSGSGYGKADDEGRYNVDWKVPDTAPNGEATVHVIADNRIHSQLKFKVVGPADSC